MAKKYEYMSFYRYLYKKNQESAIPAEREAFFNIAQEIVHEINIMVDRDGFQAAFEKLRIPERNEKS